MSKIHTFKVQIELDLTLFQILTEGKEELEDRTTDYFFKV